MKPRNARLLDNLLGQASGGAIYEFVRDGHSTDLAEVLGGLESRLQLDEARIALVNFAWMLIEARPSYGADEARRRDRLKEKALAELKSPPADCKPGSGHNHEHGIPDRAIDPKSVDEFVAAVLRTIATKRNRS